MSICSVYIIKSLADPPDRAVGDPGLDLVGTFENSHGYYMSVWAHIWAVAGRTGYPLGGRPGELTALAWDQSIPEHVRIAHATTLGRAIIAPEDVERVAAALDMTADEIVARGGWSHLREVAALLRATPLPEDARGFGLDTTLSDVWDGYLSDDDAGFNLLRLLVPPVTAPPAPPGPPSPAS